MRNDQAWDYKLAHREGSRHLSVTFDINRPPAQVMQVLLELPRWPEWTASMTSIEMLDDKPIHVGTKARVRQPKLFPAIWEITELEEKSVFTWVTKSPGVIAIAKHQIVPVDQRSRMTFDLRFEGLLGPIVAIILKSINERYLRMEAQGLKSRCEK